MMEHYAQKFGPQQAAKLLARSDPSNVLNLRGKPMGLEYRYHPNSKVFQSRMAHQLLQLAHTLGGSPLQNTVQEILFRRYFKEGENLGQLALLAAAATEASISAEDFEKFTATLGPASAESQMLDRDLKASHSFCTGVPHFTFPSGKEVSGGQEISTFAKLLRQEATGGK